jgi:hypothetical protein
MICGRHVSSVFWDCLGNIRFAPEIPSQPGQTGLKNVIYIDDMQKFHLGTSGFCFILHCFWLLSLH